MNLYKQYLEVKKQHSDALVFYRVGDFYELFGQDAIVASKALDLTLTGRECGLTERVPMCGVPYHSVDSYIAKLIENGLKTAVCEPMKELPVEPKPQIIEPASDMQGRLKLTATGTEQTIILEYLKANASDVLVEKINNGVRIQKDGKTLINKKTLETFMKYACEEAQKLAEKGARAAAVKSDVVFGWAIHYFEEESIEGTLYNEDGSEYKPPKPASKSNTTKTAAATVVTPSKEKPKTQFSLFDMLDTKTEEKPKAEEPEIDEEEVDEPITEDNEPEADESEADTNEAQDDEDDIPKGLHQVSETEWADENGEIYEVSETKKDIIPNGLAKLFGDLIIAR